MNIGDKITTSSGVEVRLLPSIEVCFDSEAGEIEVDHYWTPECAKSAVAERYPAAYYEWDTTLYESLEREGVDGQQQSDHRFGFMSVRFYCDEPHYLREHLKSSINSAGELCWLVERI